MLLFPFPFLTNDQKEGGKNQIHQVLAKATQLAYHEL
jgi:hypothetical protein